MATERRKARLPALALAGVILCGVAPGAAEEPLSAIDWLSDNLAASAPFHIIGPGQDSDSGPALSGGVTDEHILVTPLGASSDQAIGLFPAERVGLPREFWGPTPAPELAAQVRALSADTLPAAQQAIYRILLAEFAPPVPNIATDPGTDGNLLLARIDKLKDFGALEQALQLIEAGARITPEVWQRWFDIALLLGAEDRACSAALAQASDLSPDYAGRIFCLMQGGDWPAAMLGLQTAETLGGLTATDALLLRRFLDAEDADIQMSRATPGETSPLQWRILEAIGEPVYTQALPVAFAHADLRGTAGWRAQLDAAERLTRAGALEPNRLLGLYTEARAAASGGIWDRVRAVNALEAALAADDDARIGNALIRLWPLVQAAELETAFAAIFASRLAEVALEGSAQQVAFEMALLAPEGTLDAGAPLPDDPRAPFLSALATGTPLPAPNASMPAHAMAAAVAEGLADPPPVPATLATRIADGELGHAALVALERLAEGTAGDLRAVTEALATLRALGLEGLARRAAIELLILNRTG